MFAELVFSEPRLNKAYALLENGNTNRALIEVNKFARWNPTPFAYALKALIILRSNRVEYANDIMSSVMEDVHTDIVTLKVMFLFFKEMQNERLLKLYLMNALEQFPGCENILECLFFIHMSQFNFQAQQEISRQLLQQNPTDGKYSFLMALSTMLQGEKDAKLATSIFLPLAERILEKALNAGFFRSHKNIAFYLLILKKMAKHSKALELLNNNDIIDLINEQDHQYDYSAHLLELNCLLGNWSEMLTLATRILERDPDNWTAYKAILNHGFDDEDRIKTVHELIDRFAKQSPHCRGPYLALIDFSSNLIKRKIRHPNAEEPFCINLFKDYLFCFGRRPGVAFDLAYALPLLIESGTSRLSPFSDDERMLHAVCAHSIARANDVPVNLVDLVLGYQSHVEKTPSSGDVSAANGLLLLAVAELLTPTVEQSKDASALGRLLLAAYWLAEIGTEHSPSNNQIRFLLASILSPAGGLFCLGRLLKELIFLNFADILFVSHLAMAPGPVLTIFSGHSLPPAILLGVNEYLSEFHKIMIASLRSKQRETEDSLLSAYRCQDFGRVYECTHYLHKWNYSDSLILAQTEVIVYTLLVSSSSFDDVFERIDDAYGKAASVQKGFANIWDNRDFITIPAFSPRLPDPKNKRRTFDHLCTWIAFRLELVSLLYGFSKFVAKAILCVDQISSGDVSDESLKALKDALNIVETLVRLLVSDANATGFVIPIDNSQFEYTHLLLAPEEVLISPPPLPKTNMLSFYINGPFIETLSAGVDLLAYLTRFLDSKSDEVLEIDRCPVLKRLTEPLAKFIGEYPGFPALASPPLDAFAHSESLNPSSVLIGLGVAIETLSIAVLFVTAVVAILRPRGFVRQSPEKLTKGKDPTTRTVSAPAKCLDQAAWSICSVIILQLQHLTDKLQKLAEDWVWWVTEKASEVFAALAGQTAEAFITKALEKHKVLNIDCMNSLKLSSWHPKGGEKCPLTYVEMAHDLAFGFCESLRTIKRKQLALKTALDEFDHCRTVIAVSEMSLN